MEIALLAKNKLGFVDGTCRKEHFDDQISRQWDRCNALVLSWIINTVNRDLSAGIVFASSVALVWGDLKERFNKIDGARIFYLLREIATASQGDSSIAAYFNRLKLLWDKHSALQISRQWDRCNALVLSWIINTVIPDLSVGVVFASSVALVWGDLKERFNKIDGARIFYLHREIATASQGDSSIAAYFNRLKLLWDEHSALVPYSSCGCDRAQDNLLHLLQQRFSMLIQWVCDFCKVKGHKRESCYRLIGFPPDFKFRKKGMTIANVSGSKTSKDSSASFSQTSPMLTLE
ncbi:hypothetical protein PVK06_016385 [Gossypium arboreum]|uniref:Retrotransposon gag domain-containing protein n=1 Tax=Gossypium arboreum TaxID=29729 RepID=A0ABR0Q0Z1_GOSAR|nr:hypothetical protein PVK06_016385 [Gossypium arboreum]